MPHHQAAIDMATLALERSDRSQVRVLAREIITAQEAEIAQMRSWYLSWFGEELTSDGGSMAGMDHGGMDMGDLGSLTGEEFDRAFLAMMIPHHARAIAMAESVMMGSPREETMALAEEIIATQAAEIGKMQRWREQWFPRS